MENSHEDSEIFSRSDTLHPVNYVDIVTFLLYVCFYSNDTVFDESIKKNWRKRSHRISRKQNWR